MLLTSPAFKTGQPIPLKYAYHSENLSPPLIISEIPKGAKSLVLIVDDPDAPSGRWVHWVLFDLPLVHEIKEGGYLGKRGLNSFGFVQYGGPAPPDGEHRYFFKLYALDLFLNLKEGAALKEVEESLPGHIIAYAELMGRFAKQNL
ncbi:MAG: YbhB/YbcL family Raf kinase inhibitor-like protein [Parachlamydiales bacterium]|jgi:hypothetical protein